MSLSCACVDYDTIGMGIFVQWQDFGKPSRTKTDYLTPSLFLAAEGWNAYLRSKGWLEDSIINTNEIKPQAQCNWNSEAYFDCNKLSGVWILLFSWCVYFCPITLSGVLSSVDFKFHPSLHWQNYNALIFKFEASLMLCVTST